MMCQDVGMHEVRKRAERRVTGLSKAQIVHAAVEILDEGGAEALTFRALAAHLSTGAGAIYHHVSNKSALLATAASERMTSALAAVRGESPELGIRAVMLAVFDAISSRPWVGTQLATAPWQPAVLQLLERVGFELERLGVPRERQFDAASVLVHHLLGVAGQYDATFRLADVSTGRAAFLRSAVADLEQPGTRPEFPFISRIAQQIPDHDDREQFSAGVDIILAGITAR